MSWPEMRAVMSTECANDWCAECRYPACVHDCHDAQASVRARRPRRAPAGAASRERVYQALVDLHRVHGFPPTVRELAAVTGLAVGTVGYHLHQLDASGRVSRRPGRARTATPTASADVVRAGAG